MSSFLRHLRHNRRRNACEPPCRGVEAGERHLRPDQLHFAAKDLLDCHQSATAARCEPDRHVERIVEPGGLPVLYVQVMDHEHDGVFTLEISGRHGELFFRDGAAFLVDRSSRGITLDGAPLPKGEPALSNEVTLKADLTLVGR